MSNNKSAIDHYRQNDYRRFFDRIDVTGNGEIADIKEYRIDEKKIKNEEMFDGFYAVCTNLDEEPEKIIAVNRQRWEIEESFRLLKTEFKSRPVFLQRDDRIQAHFITCFMALVIYRILEQRLDEKYSADEIVGCLKDMNFYKLKGEGYVPAYTRTTLTDDLHEISGFRTDYEINTLQNIRKNLKESKEN